jgi:predicted CXXCH cytochrome family protein
LGQTWIFTSPFVVAAGQAGDRLPPPFPRNAADALAPHQLDEYVSSDSSSGRIPLNITSPGATSFSALLEESFEQTDRRSRVKTLTNRIKRMFTACLVIGIIAPAVMAQKHPVPLDDKADTAQCVTCHADKTKGKVVHEAVSAGCLTCHVVRNIRDTTRVNLKTATVANLCFECHADKDPSQLHGGIHPPAVRDCQTCHDPHTSDNENLLVKPASGATAQENICLTCHNIGVDVPKGGSRHLALDMGCTTCHVTHKVGDPTKVEFADHLTKDVPALCLGCHDAKDPALIKAHDGQPFATANCIQCHDPHQSTAPGLAQKFVHPAYTPNGCDTCHQPAKDGKVVLTAKDVNSLCATCHADQVKEIQTAKVQHPGALGDCTTCHNPHAGRSPGFLQPGPVQACLACHTDLAEQGKKAHLHQPAFQQGCATCHTPHGGENAHLLRVGDANSLCLECHGPSAAPQPVQGTDMVSIFAGKVELPKDYFRQVPVLPLTDGRGHPMANHPVAGLVNIKGKAPFQMSCLSCHQPHASANGALLVGDQQPNMAFCDTCHTEGTLEGR